ncbi:MAG: nucleoside-triphosphatase [Tenuifilaceae bacterium]
MVKEKNLSLVWQKAAVVGSLWGAFEIVAGSFIHNLALPLIAGTMLSFTGVVILIAFQSQWRTKGVMWRAGLICAALKSISPSAVILTPMIGITLEGLLLEFGVLLFGNNITGFFVGGGLAVLSVLVFKLVRLVLVYGQGLIDAYNSAYSMAAVQLGIKTEEAWWPVVAIAVVYFLVGGIASIVGIIAGKRLSKSAIEFSEFEPIKVDLPFDNNKSLIKIFATPLLYLLFLIIYLSLQFYLNFYLSVSLAIIFISICYFKYEKVRSIIAKPKFWIPIFILSFIIPILSFKSVSDFKWLFDGTKIFFRAALVIVSFSAIGIELGNSRIKSFFINGPFETIYRATSLAFATLPGYIDHLKEMKFEERRPGKFISHFVNQAMQKKESKPNREYPIIIVTADRGSGKTTFIKEIATILEEKKISFTGFYADGTWDEKRIRNTFTLTLLPSKESILLCDTTTERWSLQGRFRFNPDAIAKGENTVNQSVKGSVVLIDEVGILEMNGLVWANCLSSVIEKNQNPILITVRHHFLENVKNKWKISDAYVFDATSDCPEDAVKMLDKGQLRIES